MVKEPNAHSRRICYFCTCRTVRISYAETRLNGLLKEDNKPNGRGERIRTSDPLVPNQVLYQAEPLPEIAAKCPREHLRVYQITA
jgi:hypothetical protein